MPATRGNGFYTSLAASIVGNKDDIWLCVGQDTAWSGGVTPPEDNSEVPNPVLYKKVSVAALVKAVTETDPYDYIWESYAGQTLVTRYFDTVTETEAIENNYRIIFLKGHLIAGNGGLNTITYRACGFYYGLTPATGHENDTILLPANVENPGALLVVQHFDNPTIIEGENTSDPQIAIQIGG